MTDLATSIDTDSEIVIGIVAAAGTNLDSVQSDLQSILAGFRYESSVVRLSAIALIMAGKKPIEGQSEFDRLTERMDAGNDTRQKFGNDALVLGASSVIHLGRRSGSGRPPEPSGRTAYVLRSLKHPAEVLTLRRIYGPGFLLIGIVASESDRRRYLSAVKGCTPEQAEMLIARDEHEGDFRQRTRDTFHLADAFVRAGDKAELDRVIELVFGHPFHTPNRDEHSMFLAFAASARSGDLSRQVGAVITSEFGDVIATGANDVPRATGGLYWPGPDDKRDHALGYDSNEIQRERIIDDILERLNPVPDDEAWKRSMRANLANADVRDITEYGRPVHAEMDAILAAGRCGTSVRGGTLYATTFPCHNCAKHIVAAGIKRVVYVEPYPKSKAEDFYADSIEVAPEQPNPRRVTFEPFVGIGPRRFLDLFSLGLSTGYALNRKIKGGGGRAREDWKPDTADIRVPLVASSYIQREAAALDLLRARLKGAKR